VDWSWDLLARAEREVWCRLAACRGGWTAEAADAICGRDVLDELTALVDKSLVRLAGDRYSMLETIREYGLMRADDPDADRRAHAEYFTGLAERHEPYLRGHEQTARLAELRADHDNLQVALRYAIGLRDGGLAHRLVAALGWYWWLTGRRAEGGDLAADALALPADGPVETTALAYALAAMNIVDGHSRLDQARQWLETAADLAVRSGSRHPLLRLIAPVQALAAPAWDPTMVEAMLPAFEDLFADADPWVAAVARAFHAHALLNMGRDRAVAVANFTDALELFNGVGDRWGISLVLEALSGVEAQEGRFAASATHAERAIDLLAELGTAEDLFQLHTRLAQAQWQLGRRAESLESLRRAEREAHRLCHPMALASIELGRATISRLDGDLAAAWRGFERIDGLLAGADMFAPQFRAVVESFRGLTAAAGGDLARSREAHTLALAHALSSSDSPVIGVVMVGCADLVWREGDPELAATMLGAADRLNGAVDHAVVDRPAIERAVRAALTAQAYEAAHTRGRAATADSVGELMAIGAAAS
jgi:tetratricopeptide (TPR) repeat protein